MIPAAIGVALIVIGIILWYARKAGTDSAKADTADSAERIANAEKDRVTSVDDIADKLQRGGKL